MVRLKYQEVFLLIICISILSILVLPYTPSSSSCEMIILRNNSHVEIIIVCISGTTLSLSTRDSKTIY